MLAVGTSVQAVKIMKKKLAKLTLIKAQLLHRNERKKQWRTEIYMITTLYSQGKMRELEAWQQIK